MKYLISTTALSLAVCMTPSIAAANDFGSGINAHEACKRGEDRRQVIGGLAGAVAGGVFGSQVSGNGARTEGSAIGAVLGGLAGVGIADKTVDCDPVFQDSNQGYAPAQTQQYSGTNHGTSSSYGGSQSYGSSQVQYEDRVTVSNHPVYSEPYYGAGAVSQGRTYTAGTVTYPPSGNNSQYARKAHSTPSYQTDTTYVRPSYQTPTTTRQYVQAPVTATRQYVPVPITTTRTYSQGQPAARRVGYIVPAQTSYVRHRSHQPQHQTHYHGRYSCDMGH